VAFPISAERLVVKSANEPQTGWTRYGHDVLPLFIALQNVFWELLELAINPFVLVDLPHVKIMHTIYGMSNSVV